MKKEVIMRKNQNFFYATVASFIQELVFFHFLIENFDQKDPTTVRIGDGENPGFLKIIDEINDEKNFMKIITSNRLALIMKMWRSIAGNFDEKCRFEFDGILYTFEIKGYEVSPGFVLKPEEIEKIQKFAGDEPMIIIAELNIGPANSE